MKKYFTIALLLISGIAAAQTKKEELTLKDLAVPSSPAFVITDIAPTLVQNPNTPKSFVLGVAQSAQQAGSLFPNNFSAEVAPYWWVKPDGRSIYQFAGLRQTHGSAAYNSENIWSGLKFTSLSVAFINKDLIPDAATTTQKTFSVGIRTTLIKAHKKGYATALNDKLSAWHTAALAGFNANQQIITWMADNPDATTEERRAQLAKFKDEGSRALLKEVSQLMEQKPVFTLDLAGAYAAYGIDDNTVKTGRSGAWSSATFHIPFSKADDNKNYISISSSFRYLADNYQKNDAGAIGYGDNYDVGGKIAFELNQLSIGVESLRRNGYGVTDQSTRTVGVINVKLMDNLFVNGAFGQDFAGPNKLISVFGINWGFGKEKLTIE
ncbi:hypothetical protein [Mucilaginibacter myungsuensis]|uniref:DUF5723 domain-containing protein n=1 Tax=Mucilaginibacter myungsuensis TaxID=649104 RepID=A0A929KZW5_9SPHI|nr:hypothetical protein [Mucilaginibacter myungsuensis]MBE9661919.1 hypothetical protein [Mucilaginibacter myungsuensis]MDN3599647.1 hypothetical protein [Mucilaginibacter myungsuensis]